MYSSYLKYNKVNNKKKTYNEANYNFLNNRMKKQYIIFMKIDSFKNKLTK